jgi:hypothetical protein
MNLEEEIDDSSLMPGNIGNTTEKTTLVEENETPRSKKISLNPMAPDLNFPCPKCLPYKW